MPAKLLALNVAVGPFNVTGPPMELAPLKNVTVPPGVPIPGGVTVTVNVTLVPFCWKLRNEVVSALLICRNIGLLTWPTNDAVIE